MPNHYIEFPVYADAQAHDALHHTNEEAILYIVSSPRTLIRSFAIQPSIVLADPMPGGAALSTNAIRGVYTYFHGRVAG